MPPQCRVGRGNHGAGWFVGGRFHVASDEALYRWGDSGQDVRAVPVQVDVSRQTPLPNGPKIIAPNHPSTPDPFLIASLVPEPTSILIDDNTARRPVLAALWRVFAL